MKSNRFSIRVVCVFTVMLIVCPLMLKGTGKNEEDAEIAALNKRVAEQDQRIFELECEVKALLAGAKISPAKRQEDQANQQKKAAESAAVSTRSAERQSMTKKTNTSRTPKISIAGINVGGDVYLYQYVPMGIPGVQPRFELYAFSALLDAQHGDWGFHSDYRLRTTRLRSFYPGNTWLQQGYVRYRTPYGEFRAGSFYRRVGLIWDDSFFGNIQYFDGLKLDPEFGVDFGGAHDFSSRFGAEYSIQYFSTDARVNGSLPGRDFVSEPGAHAKNDLTVRLAPSLRFGDNVSLTLGGSLAHGAIDRDMGPHNARDQIAGDATLQMGPVMAYGELLRQNVHGVVLLPPENAIYTLAGIRWTRGRYQPRFNFSQGNYFGLNARREYILQPGITIRLADGFSFIYEYDFWQKFSLSNRTTLDRSLNLVLLYHF